MADEDEWLKLNKGYTADLDSLQITPAIKVQSFPLHDITPVRVPHYVFIFFSFDIFACYLIKNGVISFMKDFPLLATHQSYHIFRFWVDVAEVSYIRVLVCI